MDNNREVAHKWYDYSAAQISSPPSSLPDPFVSVYIFIYFIFDFSKIFSTHVYKRTCTDEIKKIYIEPLALLMRNPILCEKYGTPLFNNAEYLVNKKYVSFSLYLPQYCIVLH